MRVVHRPGPGGGPWTGVNVMYIPLNFDCFDSYCSFTDGLCHLRFTKIEVVT